MSEQGPYVAPLAIHPQCWECGKRIHDIPHVVYIPHDYAFMPANVCSACVEYVRQLVSKETGE